MAATHIDMPALPERPANVPEPTMVKLAISVPEEREAGKTCPQPVTSTYRYLNLKITWPGATLAFEPEEGNLTPLFLNEEGGWIAAPPEWDSKQANAALNWAVDCLDMIQRQAGLAMLGALTRYAQAAGVHVWHVR